MQSAHLPRLLAHCFWADRLLLDALEQDPPLDAERLLAHVLTTEHLYFLRITGADPFPQDFWPSMDSTQRREQLTLNERHYLALIGQSIDLAQPVSYRNSSGKRFATPVVDMLFHVVLHGMHHRGQIVRVLRENGQTPPATDFIVYSRLHPESGWSVGDPTSNPSLQRAPSE